MLVACTAGISPAFRVPRRMKKQARTAGLRYAAVSDGVMPPHIGFTEPAIPFSLLLILDQKARRKFPTFV